METRSTPTGFGEELSRRFSHLGQVKLCEPMNLDFQVSNELYRYETSTGSFVVKRIVHGEALYGHSDAQARLETVARATEAFGRAGIPVESIVAANNGRFVHTIGHDIVRLYRFIEGRTFASRKEDIRTSASALRRLHSEGLGALDGRLRTVLAQYRTAYPLTDTCRHLSELREFLVERRSQNDAFGPILDRWSFIEWATHAANDYVPRSSTPAVVVHTDLHPRNVIYGPSRATMLDLDNIVIDRPFKCRAFSILRFGFFGHADRSQAILRKSMEEWCTERELGDPRFMSDLVHGMLTLETEKVVCILYRYMKTERYPGFINNIAPLHLANLATIKPEWHRWVDESK